jgi:hypothetical protein
MAYAVLRAPEVLAGDVDLNNQVKVLPVWPSEGSAEAEVTRLQGLVRSTDR